MAKGKVTKPKTEARKQQKAVETLQIIAGIRPGRATLGDVAGTRAAKRRAEKRKSKNQFK